jgi:hypothetical protein
VRTHEGLDQGLVWAGLGVGIAAPSGMMISFRPPRRCSLIGMRIVRVST